MNWWTGDCRGMGVRKEVGNEKTEEGSAQLWPSSKSSEKNGEGAARPRGAGVGGGSVVPGAAPAVPAGGATESMDGPGVVAGSWSAGTGPASFPVNSNRVAETMQAPGTVEEGEEGGAAASTSASNCSSWPMKLKLGEMMVRCWRMTSKASSRRSRRLCMRYAMQMVGEREMPASQCTSTFPPDCFTRSEEQREEEGEG